MAGFHEFLLERLEKGGFSTEDAIACFVPLARQVAKAHLAGNVAPLDGVSALGVEGSTLWYPEDKAALPVSNMAKIRQIDRPAGAIEVLSASKRVVDVNEGREKTENLQIGARDQEITAPVYLPGYVSWEHLAGHHDPLTDIFCLGMILASLACGLDLNEPEDLKAFVSHRRNLFKLKAELHPVLAKAIVRMTELSRHQRPQDLTTLIDNLEHYRDQAVDFSFDLASGESAGSKKQVIFGKLQERLFEVSRRNRLLHFRATLQSVNLTQASTPLSFNVESIRPEQILTWGGKFAEQVSNGEAVSLTQYLNFAEQIYLPSVLDRLRAESARDAAEFGFEQLRLAICFLRWANIKETPPEHYDSPLALLPVKLVKKKGVRDSYILQPLSTEAEINPVVRHLFKQLYGIELPHSIDLSETTLDQLYDELAKKIAASEPGVTARKITRPRIDLIHDQAKRRLDRYRKSARISGRGVKSFVNIDYSYDPTNYHPLGLAIFKNLIRQAPTHLKEIVQEKPAPRNFLVPPEEETPTSEKEKQFYALREESDDNPYNWDFDMCRLTLGNFRYRRMTLVRDYDELSGDGINHPGFDSIFSLSARPLEEDSGASMPLEERFHIVACDPTQTAAIDLARRGASYIIQGPPGTGKSQTITNLIADYVMRGKKVLFVCEKRAAIDVVYARLKQQELHQLCCLIHDSQTDKKEFIADLKATYEGLVEQQTQSQSWKRRRANLLKSMRDELAPLEEFNKAMLRAPASAGITARELFERAIELSEECAPEAMDGMVLPEYAQWIAHFEGIERLSEALVEQLGDGVLGKSPMRILSSKICTVEQPQRWVIERLRSTRELLSAMVGGMKAAGVDPIYWKNVGQMAGLIEYAVLMRPLADRKLIKLLDEKSPLFGKFSEVCKLIASFQATADAAKMATKNWAEKLPKEETEQALSLAMSLETGILSFLKPSWWRLRKVLHARYNFAAHVVKPRWSGILLSLKNEYQANENLQKAMQQTHEALGVSDDFDAIHQFVQKAKEGLTRLPTALKPMHAEFLSSDGAPNAIATLAGLAEPLKGFETSIAGFLEGISELEIGALDQDLQSLDRSMESLPDWLFCLEILGQLPESISSLFRKLPLNARQIESAVVDRCVESLLQSDRVFGRFNGAARDAHAKKLAELSKKWHDANAQAVLEKARQKFLENLKLSAKPAAALSAEEKEFKAAYNRGRRELEHEFGKVMRYKSIRDLVAGDSGLVISDLKPVWLMSPLSVCDTLPLKLDQFDVVIFDEASQITLEEAVPSIFRAPQAIVVGDEMQLPPTDFFSAKADGADDEGVMLSENGKVYEYDLSSNSFLNHAARNLASRMLGWHYRSRSESLISFSNWAFYDAKLLTVPEIAAAIAARPEIVAKTPEDAQSNASCLQDRPISFHLMSHGVYDNRKNATEAHYIAHLVQGMLAKEKHPSIGIVAFSEAQQSEIEQALSRLAEEDEAFADKLEEEYERQIDGQYAGLLIKNLENIQGDERDVVILSVCYGPDPGGKMRMNFGPINQSGGEKRLNVAFSRAKHHMAVVSSIKSAAITNDYNDGANCLKSYLQYAEACSKGDADSAKRILRELAIWRDLEQTHDKPSSATVNQIAKALEERGYAVSVGVGMSHFRCDIAARRHGEQTYRLGILVDTETHYQQQDLLEREMMRPQLLNAFGWKIAHVLCKDWHEDRAAVLDLLVQMIENDKKPQAPVVEEEEEAEDAWAEFDGPVEEIQTSGEATTPQQAPPAAGGDFKRYFEFVGGKSSKFWEATLAGNALTVRFGKIGSNGQSQTKIFVDDETAGRTARRLIAEKTAKGYVEKPMIS